MASSLLYQVMKLEHATPPPPPTPQLRHGTIVVIRPPARFQGQGGGWVGGGLPNRPGLDSWRSCYGLTSSVVVVAPVPARHPPPPAWSNRGSIMDFPFPLLGGGDAVPLLLALGDERWLCPLPASPPHYIPISLPTFTPSDHLSLKNSSFTSAFPFVRNLFLFHVLVIPKSKLFPTIMVMVTVCPNKRFIITDSKRKVRCNATER